MRIHAKPAWRRDDIFRNRCQSTDVGANHAWSTYPHRLHCGFACQRRCCIHTRSLLYLAAFAESEEKILTLCRQYQFVLLRQAQVVYASAMQDFHNPGLPKQILTDESQSSLRGGIGGNRICERWQCDFRVVGISHDFLLSSLAFKCEQFLFAIIPQTF